MSVPHRLRSLYLAIAAMCLADGPALASEPECFDAEVSAVIIRQTPTVAPDCEDCIIIRWPWIIELDVQRVHRGRMVGGPATVLTVQHTYYRQDPEPRRWWLRRNTLGAYNVVQLVEGETPRRCSLDSQAARPFIRPATGKTLEDLRREGEDYYGPQPGS